MKRFLVDSSTGQPLSKQSRPDDVPEQPEVEESAPRGGKRSAIWDYFEDEPRPPLTQKDKDKMTEEEKKLWKDSRVCVCKVVVNKDTKRLCSARIKRFQGNTKGMMGHLQSLHKAEYAEFLQKKSVGVIADAVDTKEVYESSKKYAEAQDQARDILNKPPLARKGPSVKRIDQYFSTQDTLEKWKKNSARQRRVDLELMLCFARCGLPFSLADHPGFVQ
jgi:hypothetical protein